MNRENFIRHAGVLMASFSFNVLGRDFKAIGKTIEEMDGYEYYVLDVFTSERYKGNPLSVVFTDTDLELSIYENISREFGYSETSFIYYSKADKALRVRSFTPTGFEVDGAGHNLLGAVYAALIKNLEMFHEQEGKRFVIMKDRAIFLSVSNSKDRLPVVGMMQRAAAIGSIVDSRIIADALALNTNDLLVDDLVPVVVKTEVAHLMVPVKNIGLMNKAIPNKPLLQKIAGEFKFQGVYCFTISDHDQQFIAQTRFLNPGIGIDEDAATGSAAGPLAGLLFHKKYIHQDIKYQILQGVKLRRPSVIAVEVRTEGIWVSGSSVLVMKGSISI